MAYNRSILTKTERYRRFFADDSPGQILASISPYTFKLDQTKDLDQDFIPDMWLPGEGLYMSEDASDLCSAEIYQVHHGLPLQTRCTAQDVYDHIDELLQCRIILMVNVDSLDEAHRVMDFIRSKTR